VEVARPGDAAVFLEEAGPLLLADEGRHYDLTMLAR
jgi:hypothetical protein